MNLYAFAKTMEKSGIRFYRAMAECTRTDGVKRAFSMLAEDEEHLLRRLEQMSQRYPELKTMECSYLDKGTIVFNTMRKDSLCRLITSDLDAYEMARDAEREVFRQYMKAAETETDPALKRMLLRIAAIERHELNDLEQLFDFVNAPNQSLEWGEFSNLDEFHNFGR